LRGVRHHGAMMIVRERDRIGAGPAAALLLKT